MDMYVGTYTGIAITATAKTAGEEDDGFDWKSVTGLAPEEKIINIGQQIKDLMEQKESFFGEDVDWKAGEGGGLADKYSAMMEDADESWIDLVRKEIFAQEGNVDPFHILCYGISADFVVKANLYVTMGMSFEFGVARRYNFSILLFHKQSTNETIDLEEAHYNFDFYVMGTVGVRVGVEFEIAVGLFSLKLDSNPEFTGSVLVACARAAHRMAEEGQAGCRTMFDIAPAYLSPLSGDYLRAHML